MERTRNDPFNPVPKGREVRGTARELALLSLFVKYEVLPTRYIYASLPSGEYAHKLLGKLNGEGYIQIPHNDDARYMDARNKEALWTITEKGERLLGIEVERQSDHFKHKVARTLAQFSFDHAPITKRTLQDILAHPKCPPVKNPHVFVTSEVDIEPDIPLFGYEHNGKFFYLVVEIDNGTETVKPGTGKDSTPAQKLRAYQKKNIRKMVRAYAEYLREHGYYKQFGIRNLSIAIIANSEGRMHSIMDEVRTEAPDMERFFLFKNFPDYQRYGFPPPTGHLVEEPWRTITGSLSIMEVLNGHRQAGDAHPKETSDRRGNPRVRHGEEAGA